MESFAYSIKIKLEIDNNNGYKSRYDSRKSKTDAAQIDINRKDYNVNLLDIDKEGRIIKGIHDIYGKLYDELGFAQVISNPARNKRFAD